MPDEPNPTTIEAYIAGTPEPARAALEQVRAAIREAVPDAVETIGYGMPTFKLNGRNLLHFGAFRRHIGFYPIPSGIEAFREELAPYEQGKGSVRFPLDRPIPLELIARIARFRAEENRRAARTKRATPRRHPGA